MTFTPPIRRVDRGNSHWYVDADGRKVPGVTKIINDGIPKPNLIGWAAKTTAGYAVDNWDALAEESPSRRLATLEKARFADRDQAARRGTDVHHLGQALVAGETVDVPDELKGHVGSYVQFLDDFDVQPILVEVTVASLQHGWAGTLDLIADLVLPDGPPTRALIDLKTSRSRVWPETALQLAAYRHADIYIDDDGAERPMPEVEQCLAVHIRDDGYSLIPVQAGPAEYRIFRYAQQIAGFTADGRDLIGDAITPPVEATS